MSSRARSALLIRMVQLVCVNSIVLLLLVFLVEGFSSFVIVDLEMQPPLAERKHTEYDEELGWINLPNVFIKDMYGSGVYFTTNSQRYRNRNNFTLEVPNGKIRIVCSGDSFTLGWGVNDDQTWCQLLTTMDERIETVNLGQGGYGVDQAYLWYKRNEEKLKHDIHIFAFIAHDLQRMESDTFEGYGKPYLEVRNNALFQANRPVPKRSYYLPGLTTKWVGLRKLNTIQLLAKVSKHLRGQAPLIVENHQGTEEVVARILEELQQANKAKGSLLVLVCLPEPENYMGLDPAATRHWREYIQAEANRKGCILVDVAEELQSLPSRNFKELFQSSGHLSVEGNRYVADVLYQKLSKVSPLSDKIPHCHTR